MGSRKDWRVHFCHRLTLALTIWRLQGRRLTDFDIVRQLTTGLARVKCGGQRLL
jgi:hypothetical protein